MEKRKAEGDQQKAVSSEAMKDWGSKPGGQNSELPFIISTCKPDKQKLTVLKLKADR